MATYIYEDMCVDIKMDLQNLGFLILFKPSVKRLLMKV